MNTLSNNWLPACIASVGLLTSILVAAPQGSRFSKPVRLVADGTPIRTESPGYATPCWQDMDGDGKKDLLVGQFNEGKINVFRNLGKGKLAAGQWLETAGEIVQVPGVW